MNLEVFICAHTPMGLLTQGSYSWRSLGGFFGKGHASDIAASISHFSSRYVGCWFRLEYFTETKPTNKQK